MVRFKQLEIEPSELGKIIRQRREELGISQKGLAELLKITPVYMNRIEKGRAEGMSLKLFKSISQRLNINVFAHLNSEKKAEIRQIRKAKLAEIMDNEDISEDDFDFILSLAEKLPKLSSGDKACLKKIIKAL